MSSIKNESLESKKHRLEYGRAYDKKNRERLYALAKIRRVKNPDLTRNTYYKYMFGITLSQYKEMLTKQNGVCGICSSVNINGNYLSIDHNHTTGKVRGLLCMKCNAALGSFGDSKDSLKKAIEYLDLHEK